MAILQVPSLMMGGSSQSSQGCVAHHCSGGASMHCEAACDNNTGFSELKEAADQFTKKEITKATFSGIRRQLSLRSNLCLVLFLSWDCFTLIPRLRGHLRLARNLSLGCLLLMVLFLRLSMATL